jgi:F0F1-type ATP synthase membrane subunit a
MPLWRQSRCRMLKRCSRREMTVGPALAIFFAVDAVAFAAPEEHGLSQKAVEIARPFGFPITNSMVVTWVVAVGLIIFAQFATRTMKRVPEGSQNFLEFLVETLYRFLEGIIGRNLVERTFWSSPPSSSSFSPPIGSV